MTKRQLLILFFAMLLTIVILVSVAIGAFLYRAGQDRIFDAVRWRNASPASDYRALAVDDLLARHRLKGMSKSEVLAFLGAPTTGDRVPVNPQRIVYRLGAKADNFFIDDFWLVLNFDEKDAVSEVIVATD